MTARLERGEGRSTVVLTRTLPHAPEVVWAALTDPRQLDAWAPFTPDRALDSPGPIVLTLATGNGGAGPEQVGSVVRSEPPHLLEYTWGDDRLRWELSPAGDGTELVLRHVLAQPRTAAGVTAGWHLCLDVAGALLAGRATPRIVGAAALDHGWHDLNEHYAHELGVDPMVISG